MGMGGFGALAYASGYFQFGLSAVENALAILIWHCRAIVAKLESATLRALP
jgi:ABC-type methionine transport system permease subunit